MASLIEILATTTLVVAISAGSLASLDAANPDTIAAELTSQEFLSGIGISAPVYDCAKNATSGLSEEDLVTLINASDKVGTSSETPIQAELRKCVSMDPFGWAGTEQEWAIPLVTKYLEEKK